MDVISPVLVGMAEIQVLKGSGQFSCLGLGSCIGLCALDPVSNVGGVVHVMLPEAFADKEVEKPGKFADTGVPELLARMEHAGASMSRIVVALAGGAQVFKFGNSAATKMDIGARNTVAVLAQLEKRRLRPIAQDTGGNLGRTVIMTIETGIIRVRTVTQGEKNLCKLRG